MGMKFIYATKPIPSGESAEVISSVSLDDCASLRDKVLFNNKKYYAESRPNAGYTQLAEWDTSKTVDWLKMESMKRVLQSKASKSAVKQ